MTLYLNTFGILSPLGSDKQTVLANLLAGDQSGLQQTTELLDDKSTWVGKIQTPLCEIPDSLATLRCRNNQLIATAYQQIASDVEQCKQRYGSERIGIVLGTSTSGIFEGEKALAEHHQTGHFPDDFNYKQQEMGTCTQFLAHYAEIAGIHYTVSTACSSSGKAIAAAARLINAGFCDAVITGGSDTLCQLTLNGFNALELISESPCNPFSANRNGLNIGEASVLFLLSKEPGPIKLSGTGESSDGYHISAPDPKGVGASIAIYEALAEASLTPDSIGYINLHGTATQKNDAMESEVVSKHFSQDTLCSSTKPLTGHALGAASAQELAFCWLLLSEFNKDKQLPAQINDDIIDSALKPINLVPKNSHWSKPAFMSNSFAFGGSNVSLIIEPAEHSNV